MRLKLTEGLVDGGDEGRLQQDSGQLMPVVNHSPGVRLMISMK